MARYFIFIVIVVASYFLSSNFAIADEIGTGKPNGSSSSQAASTDDEIGTGSWSEQLLQWFEPDDSE